MSKTTTAFILANVLLTTVPADPANQIGSFPETKPGREFQEIRSPSEYAPASRRQEDSENPNSWERSLIEVLKKFEDNRRNSQIDKQNSLKSDEQNSQNDKRNSLQQDKPDSQSSEGAQNLNRFLESVLGKEKTADEVDHFVRTVMRCKHVPGLSVAVVRRGQSWARGYGARDLGTGVPVDAGTLFGVGSVTKTFTSALLALAVEEVNRLGGDVSWQTKVKEVIDGDLDLSGDLEVNVTLEDVLSHRTGLMAADMMVLAGFPRDMPRERFLRELRYLPDYLPFRLLWHYNNWIYSLAGDVTEYLLGDKWNTLLKERLLWPLGMKDSAIVWDDINVTSSKMARPYQLMRGSLEEVDESLYDLRQARPSGSLAVSADDMVKWMKLLLRKGLLPSGQRLIGQRLVEDLTSSHVPLVASRQDVPVGDGFDGYGLGWFTGEYRGKRTVSHTGGWFGYLCSLTLFPEQDAAVYVATNGPGTSAGNDAFRAISYFLADLALGHSPWLNLTTACVFGDGYDDEDLVKALPDAEEKKAQPEKIKDPGRYVGTYGNPLLGDVVIGESGSARGGGLTFRLQRLEGVLVPGGREFQFQVRFTGRTAFYSLEDFRVRTSRLSFSRFNLTPQGRCSSLVLRAPPPHNGERMEFTRKG